MQHEEERGMEVMMHNLILLRHLTEISNSKRVDNGIPIKSRQRMSWNGYYDTILNMRRLQLEDMRQRLLDEGATDGIQESYENGNQPNAKVINFKNINYHHHIRSNLLNIYLKRLNVIYLPFFSIQIDLFMI